MLMPAQNRFNVCYLFIGIIIMHCRLLKGELWKWIFEDLGFPFVAVATIGIIAYWLFPPGLSQSMTLIYIGTALLLMIVSAIIGATQIFELMKQYFFRFLHPIT